MPWVLLDIGIGVLAVLLLLGVAYALFRRVRTLGRTVGEASRRVGELTPGLAVQPPSTSAK